MPPADGSRTAASARWCWPTSRAVRGDRQQRRRAADGRAPGTQDPGGGPAAAEHAAGVRRRFDAEQAAVLDAELTWYAGLLGAVRDCDVLAARLADHIAALPAEYVLGPVAARVQETLGLDRRAAVKALDQGMSTERYQQLLDTLRQWRTAPPLTKTRDRQGRKGQFLRREGAQEGGQAARSGRRGCRGTSPGAEGHQTSPVRRRTRPNRSTPKRAASPAKPNTSRPNSASTRTRRVRRLSRSFRSQRRHQARGQRFHLRILDGRRIVDRRTHPALTGELAGSGRRAEIAAGYSSRPSVWFAQASPR